MYVVTVNIMNIGIQKFWIIFNIFLYNYSTCSLSQLNQYLKNVCILCVGP